MTYATNGWAALADPTRRTIFERLIEHPSAVGELARELPVSRPAVSQHLKVLKDAGLVIDKQAGKQRIYRVNPEGLAALRAELDRFWTKTLAAYKTVVERPIEGDPMSTQAADTSDLLLSVARRSEEHTSELQSRRDLVCRLLLEKKKI